MRHPALEIAETRGLIDQITVDEEIDDRDENDLLEDQQIAVARQAHPLFQRAADVAREQHRGDKRKGDAQPSEEYVAPEASVLGPRCSRAARARQIAVQRNSPFLAQRCDPAPSVRTAHRNC